MKPYTTIRIWEETRRLAKTLAIAQGETLVKFLHRLVMAEFARVQKDGAR